MKQPLYTTSAIFFFAVLIFIGFGYNQRTTFIDEALAQKVELICLDKEIPAGTLVDEADKFHQQLLTSLFNIASSAKAQIKESKLLTDLESEAKVQNCTSSCTTVCSKEGGCSCITNSCTGQPFSTDAKSQVESRIAGVNGYYGQVQQENDAIKDLLGKKVPAPSSLIKNCPAGCGGPGGAGQGCPKECLPNTQRTHIMNALADVRRALQACVTPVNQQTSEGEIIQRTDAIYSCQEAKYLKILNDAQQQCQTNNFFCCSLQVVK
ncbi:MAG: hypothetical protein Q7S63_03380 [bacterium]|nr:hypothetical protein [bacterium]